MLVTEKVTVKIAVCTVFESNSQMAFVMRDFIQQLETEEAQNRLPLVLSLSYCRSQNTIRVSFAVQRQWLRFSELLLNN